MEELVVPKALLTAAEKLDHSITMVKVIADWLTKNPGSKEILLSEFAKLDRRSLEYVCNALIRNNKRNVMELINSVKKRQDARHTIDTVDVAAGTKPQEIPLQLSNGLACKLVIKRPTRLSWTYLLETQIEDTTITIELWYDQLHKILADAPTKCWILKRIKPRRIYLSKKNGEAKEIPESNHQVVLAAIVDRIPVEIAVLIKR